MVRDQGGQDMGGGGVCWTRALELRLVELVREREVLWRPRDNTNHNIQLKYRAYAELARLLSPHATARAVRDRWVNIRSTYNHNVRKVSRSLQAAAAPHDVYVPSWPLWRACQFLSTRRPAPAHHQASPVAEPPYELEVDEHAPTTRARRLRSSPVRRPRIPSEFRRRAPAAAASGAACRVALRELVQAARPLAAARGGGGERQYWWLGRYVAERLSSMRPADAARAAPLIARLLRTA